MENLVCTNCNKKYALKDKPKESSKNAFFVNLKCISCGKTERRRLRKEILNSLPLCSGIVNIAKINIRSEPTGADIWIDNKIVGKTDSWLDLNPGSYSIRINLKDYIPQIKSIELKDKEIKNVVFNLDKVVTHPSNILEHEIASPIKIKQEIIEYNEYASKVNLTKVYNCKDTNCWINHLMATYEYLQLKSGKIKTDDEMQLKNWIEEKLKNREIFPLSSPIGTAFDPTNMKMKHGYLSNGKVVAIEEWGFSSNNDKYSRKFKVITNYPIKKPQNAIDKGKDNFPVKIPSSIEVITENLTDEELNLSVNFGKEKLLPLGIVHIIIFIFSLIICAIINPVLALILFFPGLMNIISCFQVKRYNFLIIWNVICILCFFTCISPFVGIWGLVVLSKKEVKEAFEANKVIEMREVNARSKMC